MAKRNKIIYWGTTGFLAFGMFAQGVTQITHAKGYADLIVHLGYPIYLLTILGVWKILGVVAVLIPKFQLKEWTYAGFFFVMSGAIFSHIALGDSIKETFPSLFLLLLTMASWYFRPADRKIALVNQ
jgi:uncharacterized membrane protein